MIERKEVKKDLGEERDKIGRWLLINAFIAFVSMVCLDKAIIRNDIPLAIVELIAIPVNIEIFFVPLLVVFYIILIIRCWINKVPIRLTRKKILGITAVLIMGCYFIWFFNGVRGSWLAENIKKYEENGKYYIYNGDMKLRCTENEYNLILEDKTYIVEYSYNKLLPNIGRLDFIKIARSGSE
ncbi:hypothetical protein [Oceanirhabdus sp. W0125-5]|uniref:hypothetical protein n=1 Tax=Oceanirhabdus sp. W0125-5 TaxID=2999116 RepID=UPI0022F30A7D|nr:hypothetical protein [Oceanirhabdus sp. W0125-5]WBW96714.1 hypothetical protein OW730_23920 [Oceanirhabdus sp. W0125-5]